jgi:hypothetical protein
MKYSPEILASAYDPEQLEILYAGAQSDNEEAEFRSDLEAEYAKSPENILLSAWHSRFAHLPLPKARRAVNWGLAVGLGVITGLILWSISDPNLVISEFFPYFTLLWAPIATIPALIFIATVSRRNYLFTMIAGVALIAASAYILLISPAMASLPNRDYLTLMLIQLPLLCWIGIGIATLKFGSATADRFAFLIKSIEVMITAGVYLAFGVAFGGITLGMFSALSITPPEIIIRLAIAGGFGLIPILAIATMYDPHNSPGAQDFSTGLSKFVFTIVRLLLPLTLLVLVIYIFVIPFNFMAPFQNRNLLIIYNVMQFAIIGLLIGVTPIKTEDLSQNLQVWLRRGILSVAILALLISLYALSAVVYRTALEGLTLNRTTIIGWNVINIVILFALVVTQLRKGFAGWQERLQGVFSRATTAYLVWSILLIVFLPLAFR